MKTLAAVLTLTLTATLTAVAFDVDVSFPSEVESLSSTTVAISVAEGESATNFDEALWMALGNVAFLEYQLPEHLTTIDVEVRAGKYVTTPIHLTFERKDFQLLVVGLKSPAQFMRESVKLTI